MTSTSRWNPNRASAPKSAKYRPIARISPGVSGVVSEVGTPVGSVWAKGKRIDSRGGCHQPMYGLPAAGVDPEVLAPPGFMRLSDFHFDLPADRIAQAPVAPRDASRLMVHDRGSG